MQPAPASRSGLSPFATAAPVSWTRIMVAGGIALAADSIGVIPGETFPVAFDIAVAIALAIILGPRPILLVGLLLEAIPFVGLFPSWVAVIGAIAIQRRKAGV